MRKINNTICKQLNVRYSDCFYREHTNIVSILGFFNEIAQEAGYYYDKEKNILKDESLAWIILNWDIEVNRYPAYREQVKVCTIARSIDRFIAFREFQLFDDNDQLLARGKSKWILLNLEKRRPAVARDYMYALYGVTSTVAPFNVNKPKELKERDNDS
ncbi:MAG: acyl-ACP thioesterase domain-containing protein [Thermotogota bacterium]